MLSGEYTSLAIDVIQWDRPDRVRKKITEESILEKMESLSRLGQIHPLVVNREYLGVSGETRWTAALRLGWTHIDIQWSDTLDPRELLAIEIEENVKRTALDWKDECDGLLRLHTLYQELHEDWDQEKTAEAIGMDSSTVSNKLAVARELVGGNARVASADRYSVARGITQRQTERRKADDLSQLKVTLDEDEDDAVSLPVLPESPIVNANFLEWITTYTGQPFNFLHCDLPYGINADKFNQGAADAYGGYEDTPEKYWTLVDTILENREKLLGSSGHCIFWFSMQHYAETLARLSKYWWVDAYPLIWHKSDNKGTLPDPQRGPRRIYEVAFLCSQGDRKIIQSVSNVHSAPTTRLGEHMSEKNVGMLMHFMRMIVDENTRMLDPTCGSGSALRAAKKLGAASVLGLEMNEEFAAAARRAWDQ